MRIAIVAITALVAFPAGLVAATQAEVAVAAPAVPPDTAATPGESLHDQAQRLLAVGEARAAETPARAWLAASPDDPEAYVLLANVLMGETRPVVILDTGEAGPGDLVLRDATTGEAKGRLAESSPVPDDE